MVEVATFCKISRLMDFLPSLGSFPLLEEICVGLLPPSTLVLREESDIDAEIEVAVISRA